MRAIDRINMGNPKQVFPVKASNKLKKNLFINFDFDELADRIKFMIIYFILSIFIIILGNILMLCFLNAAGISVLIYGSSILFCPGYCLATKSKLINN